MIFLSRVRCELMQSRSNTHSQMYCWKCFAVTVHICFLCTDNVFPPFFCLFIFKQKFFWGEKQNSRFTIKKNGIIRNVMQHLLDSVTSIWGCKGKGLLSLLTTLISHSKWKKLSHYWKALKLAGGLFSNKFHFYCLTVLAKWEKRKTSKTEISFQSSTAFQRHWFI